MKNNLNFLFLVLLSSCAHYPNVRPGVDSHRVELDSKDASLGLSEALRQANSFCDDRFKNHPAILKEEAKYNGRIPEADYLVLQKTQDFLGNIPATSRSANGVDFGSPYQVKMEFKCQ